MQQLSKHKTIYSRWIFILLGLLSFLALFTYLFHLLSHGNKMSLSSVLINVFESFFYLLLILILNYQVIKKINRCILFKRLLFLRVIVEILYTVFIAIIFVIIGNYIHFSTSFIHYLSSISFRESAIAGVLINVFTMSILEFIYHYNLGQKRLLEYEALKNENLGLQYKQLKGQINPHFLFNSLTALVSLINIDTERATAYTKKLSDVYRYVLSNDDKDLVELHDELNFIKNYADILFIRFGNAIDIQFNVDEKDLKKKIVPMSLQILVENAAKHNIISASNPLHINIVSESDAICVTNNISPRKHISESTGIGLKNLEEKYRYIANRSIDVNNDSVNFTVKIPIL